MSPALPLLHDKPFKPDTNFATTLRGLAAVMVSSILTAWQWGSNQSAAIDRCYHSHLLQHYPYPAILYSPSRPDHNSNPSHRFTPPFFVDNLPKFEFGTFANTRSNQWTLLTHALTLFATETGTL